MGYRHSREEILEAAVTVALERGIGSLTFGAVGRALGIPDRTVVYYFPSKDALTAAVLEALGAELERVLAAAFGPERLPLRELLGRAWPVLAEPGADRVFARYFELAGLAAAGHEPYRRLARVMLERWQAWLRDRMVDGEREEAAGEALAALALIDGLLLLRQLLGPGAAEAAARAAGLSAARRGPEQGLHPG